MKLGDGLMTSKSERQRTSGPQKRSKSDFIYCSQCYRPRSRKLDLPLSVVGPKALLALFTFRLFKLLELNLCLFRLSKLHENYHCGPKNDPFRLKNNLSLP